MRKGGRGGLICDPWKPGQSGNPAGRKTAGAVLREWLNSFAERGLSEPELRKIAADESEPWPKRAAANRVIRALEVPDIADFEDFLSGKASLASLREAGKRTDLVKRARIRPTEHGDSRELELHDRSREDFVTVADQTQPQKQELSLEVNTPQAVALSPEALEARRNACRN